MNNIFIKAIEYLEQNPADKDIKLALTIEIPANTKPSETGTQLQMTGPVTALLAFAVQAMVDASAEFVAQKPCDDGIDQKSKNQHWSAFTAGLTQYVIDICDVCGKRHGLEVEGIRANISDIETIYDVIKSVMAMRKEREGK